MFNDIKAEIKNRSGLKFQTGYSFIYQENKLSGKAFILIGILHL